MSWEKVPLSNLADIFSGYAFKSSDMSSNTGAPLIKIANIHDRIVSEECDTFISRELVSSSKFDRFILQEDDFLVSMTGQGSVGRIGKMQHVNDIYYVNQRVAIVRVDPKRADPYFVFLQIATDKNEQYYFNKANGAGQPNLSAIQIGELEVSVPSYETQITIRNILKNYNKLIENNQKQIKLLEEAAQRLYKEWFVDLRFPGYESTPIVDGVPEGWRYSAISEFITYEIGGGWGEETPNENSKKEAYVIRGTDIYGVTHGELLSIPFRYHSESNLSARKLQDGDIVFEVSGGSKTEGVARSLLITSGLLNHWKKPVMCASFCKLIRPKALYNQYMYDLFRYMRKSGKTEEYDKRSASSIVNYRWKDFLTHELVLMPSENVIDEYNILATSIYNKIVICSLQIENLKISRDRLLPKLMSGEVEV